MSDPFERQLRQHLAQEAAQVKYFPRPLAGRIEATAQSSRRPATLQQLALVAGLVILAVLLAVGLSQARSFRSEPAGVAGPWAENLTFSGAVTGTVHSTSAGENANRSTCTGKHSTEEGWTADMFVEVAGKPYHFSIAVTPYRGPGAYSNAAGSRTVGVWLYSLESGPVGFTGNWGDTTAIPATLTIDPGDESGTVEARMTDWSGEVVQVSGRWTCRTRT